MRTLVRLCTVAAVALFATNLLYAQESLDTNRKIAGGGITVPGWLGKVDPDAEKAGQTVNDAKLSLEGNALHVMTGPAITYWIRRMRRRVTIRCRLRLLSRSL